MDQLKQPILTREEIILMAHGLDQLDELLPSHEPLKALQVKWREFLKEVLLKKIENTL